MLSKARPFSLLDFTYVFEYLIVEAAVKPLLGFKIKAGRGAQPQEYRAYFEDWAPLPNTEIEPEKRFYGCF